MWENEAARIQWPIDPRCAVTLATVLRDELRGGNKGYSLHLPTGTVPVEPARSLHPPSFDGQGVVQSGAPVPPFAAMEPLLTLLGPWLGPSLVTFGEDYRLATTGLAGVHVPNLGPFLPAPAPHSFSADLHGMEGEDLRAIYCWAAAPKGFLDFMKEVVGTGRCTALS